MESSVKTNPESVNDFYHSVAKEHQRLNGLALHYTKDPEQAQDLVQETIFKALANQEKFSRGTNLRAWLHTILRNTFRSQLKREKLRNNTFDLNLDPVNLPVHDYSGGYSAVVMQEVQAAIAELKEHQRIPLELSVKGYKYHEIADIMGISIENVKVRIHYARKQLRKSLKSYSAGLYFQ